MISNNLLYAIFGSVMGASGLISNSSTAIIGSMLVSPYTVPIGEFIKRVHTGAGPTVNDEIIFPEKNYKNLLTLLIYIIISISVGYVYYLLYDMFFMKNKELSVSKHNFVEMESRTDGRIGVYISTGIYAIIAGIIISIGTHDKTSSESKDLDPVLAVGLGIGSALLPPAVNCGMYICRNEPVKAFNSILITIVNVFGIMGGYSMHRFFIKRK